MATKIYGSTSNEYYGALNERTDTRVWVLKALGFVYERIEAYDIAVMVQRRLGRKIQTVQMGFVSHADDRAWIDKLADIKNFWS